MSPYAQAILANGPVAYYRMDEVSGNVVHDLSGNGNHGILSGTFTLGTGGVFVGNLDTAILFDGLTGTISFPSSLQVGNWQQLTLRFWVRLLSTNWQEVAIVANTAAIDLYLNGQPYTSGIDSDTVLASITQCWAGSYQNGSLDEVALYSKLLSPAQIAADFATAPLTPLTPAPEQSPYLGGVVGTTTLPVKQVNPIHAVGGALLADQPYLATAPAPLPGITTLLAGTPFTLFFQSPSSDTQASLANGKTVTLTFGLSNGRHATGQVLVSSSLSGSVFQVQCTLLSTVYL